MGMTGRQVLARVEVPMALPLVMAGVRTAAVQVVATATLGALIGYGGLGRLIVLGLRTGDEVRVFAGALAVAVLAILVVLGSGTAIATALGGEREAAITGAALGKASAAALAYVGEGWVTETEVGDEDGYYEVEITRDNGSQVDVQLDENFKVLGQEADSDEVED